MAKRELSQAQKDALAKGRAKRLRKYGLAGFAAPSTKTITDALFATGIVGLTIVGGQELERKVFKGDEKEGLKKYIGDAVKIGGGVILATQDNKYLKYIGAGMAASGVIGAAGKVMGKDILAEGILSGLDGYFNEPISGAAYDELPEPPKELPEDVEDVSDPIYDEGVS